MKPLCISLVLAVFGLAWLVVGVHQACQDRIATMTGEINEYREARLIVEKRAMKYHGILWAYYDTDAREFRFINQGGVPCKLYRRGSYED